MINNTEAKLDFRNSELDSTELVRKMREETWRRYEEEIGNALDELLEMPKSEWPDLLKNN